MPVFNLDAFLRAHPPVPPPARSEAQSEARQELRQAEFDDDMRRVSGARYCIQCGVELHPDRAALVSVQTLRQWRAALLCGRPACADEWFHALAQTDAQRRVTALPSRPSSQARR